MNSKQEQMWENLRDKDFRKQFIDEHVNVGIAFQIRSLRNRQQLKQSDLAQQMNVKQPLISSWENPNYGKYSLQTLKDLAKAFDVGLLVRFVPFSTLIDWTVDLTSDVIAPPSFGEEHCYAAASAPVALNLMNDIPNIHANSPRFPSFKMPTRNVYPSTVAIEEEEVLVRA